ncbi:MAG: hypothetical protein AAF702_40700 [Chloroflexota bacterium]
MNEQNPSVQSQSPVKSSRTEEAPLSGLDFTEIPLEKLANTFQNIGRDLLQEMVIENQKPDLATHFSPEDAQILVPDQKWITMPRRYLNYGGNALLNDFGLMVQMNFRELRRNLWRTRRQDFELWWPPRTMHAFLLNRLERSIGKVSEEDIPDDILDVVAERAWGNLAFQNEMGSMLQRTLRQNELFIQGDKALIVLSSKTYWVLLALSKTPAMFSHHFFNRDHRTLVRAIKRLHREAEKHILQTGWAGFWDQWVIWTAMSQYPGAIVDLSPSLYNALAALPIFHFVEDGEWDSQSVDGQSAPDEPPVMDEVVERVEQNENTASAESVKERIDQPTSVLANPDWMQEMPNWFRLKYSCTNERAFS